MKNKVTRSTRLERQSYLAKLKLFYKKPLVEASSNLIFTLLVVCFFVFFAIRPTLVTVVSLQKELAESKEVDQQLDRKITSLKKAQTIYGQVINDLLLVEAALPEKTEFQSLALRINYLAFQNNLLLNSAGFAGFDLVGTGDNLSPGQSKDSYAFNLSVSGSFENIKIFLTELENIDRLIKINKVSFSIEKSTAGSTEMKVDIEGEAYWYSRLSILDQSLPAVNSEPALETDSDLTL